MKPDIHPPYYENAKVRCACGAVFALGATKPEIHVEICSKCHPFYTGEEKLIDTEGRVERFRTRLRVAEARSGLLRRSVSETSEAKARRAKATPRGERTKKPRLQKRT